MAKNAAALSLEEETRCFASDACLGNSGTERK
jgi:hypothetical protein